MHAETVLKRDSELSLLHLLCKQPAVQLLPEVPPSINKLEFVILKKLVYRNIEFFKFNISINKFQFQNKFQYDKIRYINLKHSFFLVG